MQLVEVSPPLYTVNAENRKEIYVEIIRESHQACGSTWPLDVQALATT